MFPIIPKNITEFPLIGQIKIIPLDPTHGTPLHGVPIHIIPFFSYKTDDNKIYFWGTYSETNRFSRVKYETNVSYIMNTTFDIAVNIKSYQYIFVIGEPIEDTKMIKDDIFTINAKGRFSLYPYIGINDDEDMFDIVYTIKKIDNHIRIFTKVEWIMDANLFYRWKSIHDDVICREYGRKRLETNGFI